MKDQPKDHNHVYRGVFGKPNTKVCVVCKIEKQIIEKKGTSLDDALGTFSLQIHSVSYDEDESLYYKQARDKLTLWKNSQVLQALDKHTKKRIDYTAFRDKLNMLKKEARLAGGGNTLADDSLSLYEADVIKEVEALVAQQIEKEYKVL